MVQDSDMAFPFFTIELDGWLEESSIVVSMLLKSPGLVLTLILRTLTEMPGTVIERLHPYASSRVTEGKQSAMGTTGTFGPY